LILICESCREPIGGTGPDVLDLPLKASMFHSILEGISPPFKDDLKCPHCGERPFSDDVILTEMGFHRVTAKLKAKAKPKPKKKVTKPKKPLLVTVTDKAIKEAIAKAAKKPVKKAPAAKKVAKKKAVKRTERKR